MHQTRCLYFSFLFLSSVLQSFFSFSGSSLFGTQHQLTHLPVKSSTIPLKKMPIFRALHIGIQISLYPASFLLGTQQQLTHPPVKSSTLPFRALHLGKQISLYHVSSLFGTQQQLTHPPVKSSFFHLWKNHVSQGLLFYNVFTLSCLGSLWFGTYPYYH